MTFSRFPQYRAFSRAVMDEKSLSPLFPVGGGGQWLQMTGAHNNKHKHTQHTDAQQPRAKCLLVMFSVEIHPVYRSSSYLLSKRFSVSSNTKYLNEFGYMFQALFDYSIFIISM